MLIALVFGFVGSCARSPAGSTAPSDDSGAPDTAVASPLVQLSTLGVQNVVIVEVDTLRADRLPMYGGARPTMPGVSTGFLGMGEHYAATSWTNPSVISLLTALDAHEHHVLTVTSNPSDVTRTDAPMVQELIRNAGVQVALFNGNATLNQCNAGEGWDRFETVDVAPGNGVVVAQQAFRWLDIADPKRPFVMHLRPHDTHRPWAPMEEDRGAFVDPAALPFSYDDTDEVQEAAVAAVLQGGDTSAADTLKEAVSLVYDEEILGLDRTLSLVNDELELRGLTQSTLVVLTADHGETIYDRGDQYAHGYALTDELVRVPLVFFHPGLAGETVYECPTQSWDLYPTLLELLGLPPMTGVQGESVLHTCRTSVRASLYKRTEEERLSQLMVRVGEHKAVADCESGERRCHDVVADPEELALVDCADLPYEHALVLLEAYSAEVEAAGPYRCAAFPISD